MRLSWLGKWRWVLIFLYLNWVIGLEQYPFLYNRNKIITHSSSSVTSLTQELVKSPKSFSKNFAVIDSIIFSTSRRIKFVTFSILWIANEKAMSSFEVYLALCRIINFHFTTTKYTKMVQTWFSSNPQLKKSFR